MTKKSANKLSMWRYLLITLGVLQVVGVIMYCYVVVWMLYKARLGVAGSEIIVLAAYSTLRPAVEIVALINLVALVIYLAKHKPRVIGLVFSILSLIVSVAITLFAVYQVYYTAVVIPKQQNEFSERTKKESEQRQRQYAADNAKPEITKEETIELLKACKLKGFYYTNQTDKDGGGWGELSSTGVVLTKIDGKPVRVSIADRLVPELVPIAREAQKTCPNLQFWHDGNYELLQADGTWR